MKKISNILLALLVLTSIISAPGFSAPQTFTVRHIQIEGLQRVSESTVYNYLPIKMGETFDDTGSARIISALYKTGFFHNIHLAKQGNILIIKVEERPTIGTISVTGNKDIPTDKLNEILKSVGVVEGRVFDKAVLDKMQQSLQSEYYGRGKYNATVQVSSKPLPRNRVAVNLSISEGVASKIKDIRIIGNQLFSKKELLNQFILSTGGLLSFFTQDNQYSKQKLDTSLDNLRSYYMDRGYIKFSIDSTQVSLSPNRKDVYITVKITEGAHYTIGNYKITGDQLDYADALKKCVTLVPGEEFSRKKVMQINEEMGKTLGAKGYLNANIDAVPEINEEAKQVSIIFHVVPGKRIYVNQINFVGNAKTADEVFRREMRQFEGSIASIEKIKSSERRLRLLPYVKEVKVDTKPTPGTDDQVDLDVDVQEASSASLNFQIGYSQRDKFLYSAGFNQLNFMGTGKSLGFQFSNSRFQRVITVDYNDPYYTADGISRGFSAYSRITRPGNIGLSNYSTDAHGATVYFGIPMNEDNRLNLGLGIDQTKLSLGPQPAKQVTDFIGRFDPKKTLAQIIADGSKTFTQMIATTSWSRMGYDRSIFPTQGLSQFAGAEISIPLGRSSLRYYKLNYNARYFYPLWKDFIFTSSANLGYGGGYGSIAQLPFFKNYYAGGIDSVRGFETNRLGPRDSNNRAIGGNFLVAGSVGMILPQPLSSDSFRTTAFIDAGNVFDTKAKINGENNHGGIKFSAGVSLEWRSFVGPLVFSIARPLHKKPGDDLEFFQFSVSSLF